MILDYFLLLLTVFSSAEKCNVSYWYYLLIDKFQMRSFIYSLFVTLLPVGTLVTPETHLVNIKE